MGENEMDLRFPTVRGIVYSDATRYSLAIHTCSALKRLVGGHKRLPRGWPLDAQWRDRGLQMDQFDVVDSELLSRVRRTGVDSSFFNPLIFVP